MFGRVSVLMWRISAPAASESVVSEGYDRPAALFSFDLKETGLEYNVGDHLAVLPRNPNAVVERVLGLYEPEVDGSKLLSVETVDPQGDCPFPPTLTARELLTQYLDLCGRPSRVFFKQLFMFARTLATRKKLRALSERDSPDMPQEEFEAYTGSHTYADVLCDFAPSCLPPFEYLLSMVPAVTPRLYSIASSPLFRKDRCDLLVVLNQWVDGDKHDRVGLATQFLFGAEIGDRVAVQIRTGILQPPKDTDTPVLMFGLGTGLAPFRGFLQASQNTPCPARFDFIAIPQIAVYFSHSIAKRNLIKAQSWALLTSMSAFATRTSTTICVTT